MKLGKSRPGLFGGYVNYDEKGKKVGVSRPSIFLAVIITMIRTVKKLALLVLDFSVTIIITMPKVAKPALLAPASSATKSQPTAKGIAPSRNPAFSAVKLTTARNVSCSKITAR